MIGSLRTIEPQVGIFWRVPDRSTNVLVADSVSLSAAEAYGDCLTYPQGHHEIWEHWRSLGGHELARQGLPIAIISHEYEELPRGRVVFHCREKHFIIYADRKLFGSVDVDRVVKRFGLDDAIWTVRPDAHYRS